MDRNVYKYPQVDSPPQGFSRSTDMPIGFLQAQIAELLRKEKENSFERYQEMNKIKEELGKIHNELKAQDIKFKRTEESIGNLKFWVNIYKISVSISIFILIVPIIIGIIGIINNAVIQGIYRNCPNNRAHSSFSISTTRIKVECGRTNKNSRQT